MSDDSSVRPSSITAPLSPSPSDFLSVEDEAAAFRRMRFRVLAALLRYLLRHARFRLSLVIVLSLVLWAGMFWLFYDGFYFLRSIITEPKTHASIVGGLLGYFFLALMLMLVFSAGIILYGSLFRGRDVPLLLTLPARTGRVYLHKFEEAIFLSSWGFVLMGSPMLLAYGINAEAPWYFYVLLLPFLIAFIYIPVALGAMICLWVVRLFPNHRKAILMGGGVVLAIIALWTVWGLLTGPKSGLLTSDWFEEMRGRLQISDQRLLPSWWLTTGLLNAAENENPRAWADSLLFLTLLVANALFLRQFAVWTAAGIDRVTFAVSTLVFSGLLLALFIVSALYPALASSSDVVAIIATGGGLVLAVWTALVLGRVCGFWTSDGTYREAYSGLSDGTRRRRHARPHRLDRFLATMTGWLPGAMRLMMIKDLRLFRRDPLQWSQVAIFIGLLFVYFFNIPRITPKADSAVWLNMVSFLNLTVVGLLLSTFTTRFIYPMISLEGRRFWILGLLGVRRETILWGKFLFAAGGALIPCCGLVLISDLMLRMPPLILVSHQLTCVLLCLGLAGIAVGFGAWLPNMREESPSRVAAGFGGTLTLVVSTLYILVIVMLTALPTHFFPASEFSRVAQDIAGQPVRAWMSAYWLAGTIFSVFLGLFSTLVPLRLGLRTFQEQEF